MDKQMKWDDIIILKAVNIHHVQHDVSQTTNRASMAATPVENLSLPCCSLVTTAPWRKGSCSLAGGSGGAVAAAGGDAASDGSDDEAELP